MVLLSILILFSGFSSVPLTVYGAQNDNTAHILNYAGQENKMSIQAFLQNLNTVSSNKQAIHAVRRWINRPLKPAGKGLSCVQTLGIPKRVVNTLSFNQVVKINKALTSLPYSAVGAKRVLLRGAASEQNWPDSLTPIQQIKTLKMLRSLDKTTGGQVSTKDIEARLRQAIFKTLVLTNLPTNTAGLQYVASLAERFAYSLSAKQCQAALKNLNDTVFLGGKVKANISAAAFRHALLAADFLGMKDSQQAVLVLQWINSSNTWDHASIYDLSYFLSFVKSIDKPPMHNKAQSARATLINQITNRIGNLSGSKGSWAEKIELSSLIGQALRAASKQQSKAIAQALKSVFNSPQEAAALMDQTNGLALRLFGLSDKRMPKLRTHFLASWVLNGNNWHQAARLDWIAPVLAKSSSTASKKALQHILDTVRHDPILSAQVVASGSTSLNKMLGDSFENKFAARMHQAAKDQKTLPLSFFTDLAKIEGASKSNGDSSLFIDTLTIYLNHGGTLKGKFKSFQTLGHFIANENIIKQLRKRLISSNGSPRMGIAKILTWAYSADKDNKAAMQRWSQYLKSQSSNTKLSGDKRGLWYIALSYPAQILSAQTSASPGLNWIIKAYNTVKSQKLRLWCARRIIQAYIDFKAFDQAKVFLNKAKEDLSGKTVKQTLNKLTQKLQQTQAKTARHNRQIAQKRRVDRIKGSIEHMQKLLAQAKKQNQPANNLQSLQIAITKLKQQLVHADQHAAASWQGGGIK